MATTEVARREQNRLSQLRGLRLLDTHREERFDRITRLSRRMFDVPIALVTLVDENRQWFKSVQGLEISETPRDQSFCSHAILEDRVFVVPDASADPRFADNPLVTGEPHIRFYAGCPIAAPGGARVGSLCIIDRVPREFSAADDEALRDLAAMVEREIAAVDLALRDELTGLANRRGFDLIGRHIAEVCHRGQTAVTLLFLDMDGLKPLNDTFGHGEGDRALAELGRHLEQTLRGSDLIARVGGDEFAALLSGSTRPDEALERLRKRLDEHTLADGSLHPLAVSVGFATSPPGSTETVQELLARADASMYEDKKARRPRR